MRRVGIVNRKIGRLGPFEQNVDVAGGAPNQVSDIRPAACVSLKTLAEYGLAAFQSTATRASRGSSSLSNSRRLPPRSGAIRLMPVTLPPGRARLATSP